MAEGEKFLSHPKSNLLIGVNILSSLRLGQRYAAHELLLGTREHGRVFGRLLELYVLNVVFFRSCPHRSTNLTFLLLE